jgi:carotenoid cleavage dioxygenase-like enzyme
LDETPLADDIGADPRCCVIGADLAEHTWCLDGVLMGYVYDRTTDRSELAILDAQTLQDIASIKLPHRVPAGFHGNWVPSPN